MVGVAAAVGVGGGALELVLGAGAVVAGGALAAVGALSEGGASMTRTRKVALVADTITRTEGSPPGRRHNRKIPRGAMRIRAGMTAC